MRSDVRARTRLPPLFWIGVLLLVVGNTPLLVLIAAAKLGLTSDPDPNPIGFGMLSMLTFWPGIILAIVGLVMRRRATD